MPRVLGWLYGVVRFLISEVPLYHDGHVGFDPKNADFVAPCPSSCRIQGYLAHKTLPLPLGPPRHGPTVGSYGVAITSVQHR